MSDNDVPIETIADLVGHRTTIVTQTVYRHQLRPVIETGATAMNSMSGTGSGTSSTGPISSPDSSPGPDSPSNLSAIEFRPRPFSQKREGFRRYSVPDAPTGKMNSWPKTLSPGANLLAPLASGLDMSGSVDSQRHGKRRRSPNWLT
jgi:hypothetical protein